MDDAHPQPVASRRSAPPPLEARLGWLGISFAALYLASVYIKLPFLRPGVTVGDLIDVLTPLILIFLLALAARAVVSGASGPSAGARMLLVLGGFALVLGHGMHVAANSIDDAIARAGIQDPGGLVDWWDEHVSHFAIDGSKVALCLGLTALERRAATGAVHQPASSRGLFVLGVLAYGFIYFAAGVEGQTVMLLLPFSAAYLVWSLSRRRPFPPVRRFYTLAALVSILLFAVWGIWHAGFPEFSTVGLIPSGP
jgi:hypothetical protein